MKYNIYYEITITHDIEIEANSMEEAIDKADMLKDQDMIEIFAEEVADMDLSDARVETFGVSCQETGEEEFWQH